MKNKTRILITNDDGIDAPGIRHLWNALVGHYEVFIIAPSSEKSGAGLSITLRDPLHIQEEEWDLKTLAWKITGTPADCVRLGLSVLLKDPPDLIVSGINRGSNSGRNVLYSGTVGAAIEGALRNVPSIAFSCEDFDKPDYVTAQKYTRSIVDYVLDHPLPLGTLLNVTFPTVPTIRGIKLASQGRGYWKENPDQRLHPEGRTYYWLGGKWYHQEEEEISDVFLLKQGYITAVPIHIHELTDRTVLKTHAPSFEIRMQNALIQVDTLEQ